MSENNYTLPMIEYCSLDRATRLIGDGCEISDLIHWALEGKIRLANKFNASNDLFRLNFICDEVDKLVGAIVENKGFYNGEYFLSPSSLFLSHTMHDSEIELREYFSHRMFTNSELKRPFAFSGVVTGVWDINKLYIDSKYTDKYRFDSILPLDESFGLKTVVTITDSIGISEDDLLISRKYIDIITGGKYGKLRVLPHVDIEITPELDSDNKEPGARTDIMVKNRAAFIKALLSIHYGDDVAENPRKHIDNTDGELRKDFELSGIALPTGKTIEDWLKGIDIKR
ncbi:TPA: hypothetical protein U5D88_004306 [Yersinia enterocolitica]|jgi:hypothetical protein|nr:hypothetical protein [Yersinia enterocolitica]